jgi:hypothetical protein
MARHRTFSSEFKRLLAKEFLEGAGLRDGLGAFSLAGPRGRFRDADHDVPLTGITITSRHSAG